MGILKKHQHSAICSLPILTAIILCLTGCPGLDPGVDYLALKQTPASSQLIEMGESGSTLNLGWFDAPFETLNLYDADDQEKQLPPKQWHFFSLSNGRYRIGVSIVNVGYMASSFVYAFDAETEAFLDCSISTLAIGAPMAPNSISGASVFNTTNHYVEMVNADSVHQLEFQCAKEGETLSGAFQIVEQGAPLVNVREVRPGKLVYTHQNSLCRFTGTLDWNGECVEFSGADCVSVMDFTLGRHNYDTYWKWAAGGGQAQDGTDVAINLAIGSEEDSVVAVYWVGDDIYRLAEVSIEEQSDGQWIVSSPDGVIDLIFVPDGEKQENIEFTELLKAEFRQPFGRFYGTMYDSEGIGYAIDGILGVTEDHQARW